MAKLSERREGLVEAPKLSAIEEAFSHHLALGYTPGVAARMARQALGIPAGRFKRLHERAEASAIVARVSAIRAELLEKTNIDALWIMNQRVEQYRKADAEQNRTNARHLLNDIEGSYESAMRMEEERRRRALGDFEGMSLEQVHGHLGKLLRIVEIAQQEGPGDSGDDKSSLARALAKAELYSELASRGDGLEDPAGN